MYSCCLTRTTFAAQPYFLPLFGERTGFPIGGGDGAIVSHENFTFQYSYPENETQKKRFFELSGLDEALTVVYQLLYYIKNDRVYRGDTESKLNLDEKHGTAVVGFRAAFLLRYQGKSCPQKRATEFLG